MTPAQAYRRVRTAVANGTLIRPDCCGRCGNCPPRGSDGRSTIHAHHHDYSKPLDVEWLCAQCHRADTPLPLGERGGSAKLTEAQARAIRISTLSSYQLSSMYGVDRKTIRRIRQGETWAWLSALPPPTEQHDDGASHERK